jgi:hypothetical protein
MPEPKRYSSVIAVVVILIIIVVAVNITRTVNKLKSDTQQQMDSLIKSGYVDSVTKAMKKTLVE